MLVTVRTRKLRIFRYICNGFKYPSSLHQIQKYGDDSRQVFFGYYDLTPIKYDDSILLAVRASINNKPVQKNAFLDIGYYKLQNKESEFILIDKTTTWCWQQGCRLQWYPVNEKGRNNLVIYNRLVNNQYGSCIRNIKNRKILDTFKRPVYTLSPDGQLGLSLNFARLGRLRPGYGYVSIRDNTEGQNTPNNDGIWRIDMKTGEDRLLFSISDIANYRMKETKQGAEHYFNHISVNTRGDRFLFYHIWVKNGKRHMRLITCNMDGTELYVLINEEFLSHYTWKSPDEILCFSEHAVSGMKYHLYKDKTSQKKVVGENYLQKDGHPTYSPNGQFLLTDSYPDKYSDRHLLLFDYHSDKLIDLGGFFSPYNFIGEVRCDLHPRWSASGRYVVFDSAHEKKRSIYLMDISDV